MPPTSLPTPNAPPPQNNVFTHDGGDDCTFGAISVYDLSPNTRVRCMYGVP